MKAKPHCIALLMLALAAFAVHADEKTDVLLKAATNNNIAKAKRGAEAESRLRTLFGFEGCLSKEIAITEHSIDEHGWLEHDELKNTGFSECQVITIEDLEEIPCILYYPIGSNTADWLEGMFEINNQKFIIHNIRFDSFGIKILSVDFGGRTFLLLLGGIGKYGDKICFMFDITNPGRIVFYPPENRFVCKELAGNFFGPYQGRLCFFLSARRFDWNGQYRLSPYFIDGGALKELRDESGNPYFVDYAFTTKYEQEFVIEGMNVPENSASQKSRWKLRLAARCENRFRR